jgi:hypothetical protein
VDDDDDRRTPTKSWAWRVEPVDQNSNPTFWAACMEQPGAGFGDLIATTSTTPGFQV